MKPAFDIAATEVSPNLRPVLFIPDHELLSCVGRGSYGEVWLARNTMMGIFRAVKIVFAHTFKDSQPFAREIEGIRTFEPVSRSHEGLVDVLQVGQNQAAGYFYYVMEVGDDVKTGQEIDPNHYVPRTLAKEISIRGRLPFDECLRLGLTLSSALGHLHGRGLIHRDVKPANIIFVNGAPKLADIGLVTEIERAGSYVGTEGFIPPEGPSSPQADIYGIGKVLYEAATGKDRQEFPELPADFQSYPDSVQLLELNEVLVKACHHDALKRYRAAKEMHADLTVLETGNSVKRLRLLEHRWATLRSFGKLAAVLLLVAGLAGYEFMRKRNESAKERERLVGAEVANGTHALEGGNFLASLPHFVQALRLDQNEAWRVATHRVRLAAVLAYSPKLVRLWSHPERINSVEFSPDGRSVLAGSLWGQVHVWDLETGKTEATPIGPQKGLLAASFSPDGRLVLTASGQRPYAASVWRRDTGKEVLRLPHSDQVLGGAFGRSGARIVTACKDKKAYLWDAVSGERLFELGGHIDSLLCAQFSADEQQVVTASMDNTAVLWNARTGERIGQPLQHPSWVYQASFSPDGRFLVTAGFDRKARLWAVPSGQELPALMHHGDAVRSARFSPDGRFIVTASLDGTARLWDATSGLPLTHNALFPHSARVTDAAFSPDGHRFVTSCTDGTVRVFDLAVSQIRPQLLPGVVSLDGTRIAQISNLEVHVRTTARSPHPPSTIKMPRAVEAVVFNRDGRFLMAIYAPAYPASGEKRALQAWNASSGEPISPLIPYTNSLTQTYLSDDGQRIATITDRSVWVRAVPGAALLAPCLSHTQTVTMVHFGRKQGQLATVCGNQVHLWNIESGRKVFPPLSLDAAVSCIQFSPDGNRLLTCTSDINLNERSAQIWDAATGQAFCQPLWHRDGVLAASWSSDGRRIVTASEDFTAIVWDAATGKQLVPALRHEGQVRTAAFSPDGRWIVTACADKTVRLWDAHTGVPLTPPLEHESLFQRAVFVPEGPSVVTTTTSGEAWLWELPRDNHALDALEMLSQMLASSRQPLGDGKNRMQEEWQKLTAVYPEDSSAKDSDAIAWHLQQANEAEKNKQWFAAGFHLEQLRAMKPLDHAIRDRLAQAQRARDPEPEEVLARP